MNYQWNQNHLNYKEWDHQFSVHRTEWQQALDLQQQQHEALAAQLRDIERRCNELSEQGKQQQHDLEQLRSDLLHRFLAVQTTMQEALQEIQQHVDRIDQDSRQRADQVRQEIVALLLLLEERLQDQFTNMQEALMRHDQEHKQLQLDWTEVQEALLARQETFTTHVEQQLREVNITFDQSLRREIEGLRTQMAEVDC